MAMTRRTKYLAWLAGALLVCLLGYVGFWLQLMNDYGKGVIWETADGGLWMYYWPMSPPDFVTIRVRKAYTPGGPRDWRVVHAGATDRWILPLRVPPLDEQFARAAFDPGDSDLEAAIRFYAEATQRQKGDIVRGIEVTCRGPNHNGFSEGMDPLDPEAACDIVRDAFATGNHPWLEPVFAACAAPPPATPRP
jgi:hypothetical protein